MSSQTSQGFVMSAGLHGLAAALLFFGYLVGQHSSDEPSRVLELVAGEGDNYAATAAPALGSPGGATVTMPTVKTPVVQIPKIAQPEPEPEPLSPVEPAPPVVERAPVVTKAPPEAKPAPAEPIRDFSKDVKRISTKRKNRLEAKYRAQREAEEKAAERRRKEAELASKRMTKAEFDAQNRREAADRRAGKTSSSAKVSHIDAEGIAAGVVGGSTANKVGGAGGKALTRDEGDVLDAYFAYLKRRLHEALDTPPGLSDSLVAVAEMRIAADGTLSGARIVKSSGSDEFDQAALDAIARVRSIGPRPDGKSETIRLSFKMKEEDED